MLAAATATWNWSDYWWPWGGDQRCRLEPLIYAAWRPDRDRKYLLDKGADIDAVSEWDSA